jgi:hypothetical protein
MALINDLVGSIPSPTISPTFTSSPSVTESPTISPTFTVSPTCSPTPSVTPTPAYAVSNQGYTLLAPVPAHPGQPVCLYFDKAPASTRWRIFNVAGQNVAALSFGGQYQQCWDTSGVASGVYFARIDVEAADGTSNVVTQKIVVLR